MLNLELLGTFSDRVGDVVKIIQSIPLTHEKFGKHREGMDSGVPPPPHRRPYNHGHPQKQHHHRQLQWRPITASPNNNKRRLADLDSVLESTDDTKTLVDGASCSYYSLPLPSHMTIPPPAPPPKRAPIFLGKIIPNIGDYDFEADEGPSDTDTDETFFSYGTPTSETSSLPIPGKPIPILDLDKELPKLPTLEEASRPTELIECVTALSPPPLHHSRKTRSKVVFVPRDAPGTCPIHGCGDCGLCDPTKPFVFSFDI